MEYTDGSMKFKVRRFGDDGGGGLLPGAIIAFSGSFSDDGYPINKGTPDKDWHLCDGTNGTPDLRGRFILGASDSHAKGTTGGEETHTLTESELPKVTPTFSNGGNALVFNGTGKVDTTNGLSAGDYWADINKTASSTLNPIGGDAPHNNMPPFYTLSYIMKL